MLSQPPQWPEPSEPPAHTLQPPSGSLPTLFSSRSRFVLAAVSVVSGVLIVALLSALVLLLTHSGEGVTPGAQVATGQSGQTQSGETATAGTHAGNGTPS